MHFDINTLTALAVFLHLGLNLAATLLRSHTDQGKIARIDAGVTQAVTTLQAVATAIGASQAAQASTPPPTAPTSPAPPNGPGLILTNGGAG